MYCPVEIGHCPISDCAGNKPIPIEQFHQQREGDRQCPISTKKYHISLQVGKQPTDLKLVL